MRRRNHYTNGPRWIHAKYPGRCHCGRAIRPGDRALYFPGNKKLSCRGCGPTDRMRIWFDDITDIFRVR